jgi:SpoVK/Ycf46/Vps4 family AAA+-type ATPase
LLATGASAEQAVADAARGTAACRALDALAQPLPEAVGDAALVVADGVRDELARVLQRCAMRAGLHAALGVAARTRASEGVRMLFTGASGTGKSLAAMWLATRLGLPIFRVDLSAMLSKWIGETEKNLAELLARAEHADVVLLFDEADTLFGKRTEVSSANDRFANAQTNYLLQRIESHAGIVVLTSNSRSRFDPAFVRRLDFIVDFPAPDAQARRALWAAHLGDATEIDDAQLNRLAAWVDLSGGGIRNAVLAAQAAALARAQPIGIDDIAAGVRSELRKLGRAAPPQL